MSICKDCIHYEICDPYVSPNESVPETEGGCKCFKTTTDAVKARADAITEFAERLKNYYSHIKGGTHACLAAYHIDQIAQEMLEKPQKCD